MTAGGAPPVVLVRGAEEVVQRDAVRHVVDELLGDADRSLAVEELTVGAPEGDEVDPLLALVDAAQTPPFLTDRRVVVGRIIEKRSKAAEVAPLVGYLADPLTTTRLVLDWSAPGSPPKPLLDAIAACGGRVDDAAPGRRLGEWIDGQLRADGLKVDAAGRSRLETWLGEDAGKLIGLVDLLRSTYGDGARLGVAEIDPFLGDDGGVPPWELTDAIDAGQIGRALELLHRMLGAGRHPFQLLATLHAHYARILRLDGAPVRGDQDAAQLLGLKGSTFPARKAMAQARRLGHDRVVDAVELVATADLDLRGAKAWPDELVLEVLVARLARLSAVR